MEKRSRFLTRTTIALLLPYLAGCGENLVLVDGTVRLDGKPFAATAVVLHPVDRGRIASGSTDANGHFGLEMAGKLGVAPGKYSVTVVKREAVGTVADKNGLFLGVALGNAREIWVVPQKYARPDESGITVDVKSGMKALLTLQQNCTTTRRLFMLGRKRLLVVLSFCAVATSVTQASRAASLIIHVAPGGSDTWSGRLRNPKPDGSDGPLATLRGARDAIRRLRSTGSLPAVTVLIRGGTYRMTEPFVLESQDSGTAAAPIVYTAEDNQRPVLSGGRPIGGWKAGPGGLWTAQLPEVAAGQWHFQQLFVNGQRRTHAKSPNEGYFYTAGKAPPAQDAAGRQAFRDKCAFLFSRGDIKNWPDLPMLSPTFERVDWMGFSSTAASDTAFYLDNLKIERIK